jgi:hypothetical protein
MRHLLKAAFLLCLVTVTVSSKAQLLIGRVLAENGTGAKGVTVAFLNKSNSVVTKSNGSFTIIAKRLPDTLVFSAPGFEPYTIVITEKNIKDPSFEVVLLAKRTELTAASVARMRSSRVESAAVMDHAVGSRDYMDMKIRGTVSGISSSSLPVHTKKLALADSTLPGEVKFRSQLLTAGEINDFNKWKMWEDLTETEVKASSEHWKMFAKKRFCVQLQTSDHRLLINEPVYLLDAVTKDTVWRSITDNTGKAELWAEFKGAQEPGRYVIASTKGNNINTPAEFSNGINRITLNKNCNVSKEVDISFVVDATGSMGDEIEFLKMELEDVIRKTFDTHSELDLKVSSVFYRDRTDEYLVRKIDFQADLLKVLNFIKLQAAGGGGDKPEAVHSALSTALDSLQWRTSARTRMLFLILDAPPHDEDKTEIYNLTLKAAAKGIRIIPVVCSGADKSTEFLMRSMALATNGTYVFLTDNSGVGLPHMAPSTDAFSVELFNALLQRIIGQMIFTPGCNNNLVAETKNIPANVEGVSIFPNPTRGPLTLESKKELKQVFVTDFTGKILVNLPANAKNTIFKASLNSYPSGTYLVKYVTGDNKWGAEKVVVMH